MNKLRLNQGQALLAPLVCLFIVLLSVGLLVSIIAIATNLGNSSREDTSSFYQSLSDLEQDLVPSSDGVVYVNGEEIAVDTFKSGELVSFKMSDKQPKLEEDDD